MASRYVPMCSGTKRTSHTLPPHTLCKDRAVVRIIHRRCLLILYTQDRYKDDKGFPPRVPPRVRMKRCAAVGVRPCASCAKLQEASCTPRVRRHDDASQPYTSYLIKDDT